MKLEDKINSIDKRLTVIENNPLIIASNNLSVQYFSDLLGDFEKKLKGNPLTAYELKRRRELTSKLDTRTITPEEAKELRDILEKELAEARAMGNFLMGLVILFLLGLVISAL